MFLSIFTYSSAIELYIFNKKPAKKLNYSTYIYAQHFEENQCQPVVRKQFEHRYDRKSANILQLVKISLRLLLAFTRGAL